MQGDFVTTGNAIVSTIDATFDGIDCDDGGGALCVFRGLAQSRRSTALHHFRVDDHVRETHAMPILGTRTVSTKVTEDDYALIAQLAGDQRATTRPDPVSRDWP